MPTYSFKHHFTPNKKIPFKFRLYMRVSQSFVYLFLVINATMRLLLNILIWECGFLLQIWKMNFKLLSIICSMRGDFW